MPENIEKPQSESSEQSRAESSAEIQPREKSKGLSHYGSWVSNPFSFMKRFSEEMDRVFEDFGFTGSLARATGGRLPTREFGRGLWNPPIEMYTRGDQLIVRAELPGLAKEDVKVECTDDEITIHGERKQEQREEHEGTFHTERMYGRFFRRIPLPEGTRADEAKATFKDGILEITMTAPKQLKSREISIEGS